MENASKALIIAGAILLSILIIAIGMYVYNAAAGTVEDSTGAMDTYSIESFNAQFTQYEGTDVLGSEVKTLISKVIANNKTYSDNDEKKVEVSFSATNTANTSFSNNASSLSTLRSKVATRTKYTVTCENDDDSGLVHKIKITKN